jgi:hypothetical protein
VGEIDQPVVGHRHPMRIAPDIIEDLAWAGAFRIDRPLDGASGREVFAKPGGVAERRERAGETQSARVEGLVQTLQKEAAKEPREDPHAEEEAGTTRDPARAVATQAAAGDHAMHVRMMLKLLAPRVEHEEETDLGAEMRPVGGNGPERRGGRPKQDAVHDGFVAVGDLHDRVGHRKDDVEVRALEDLGLALLDPLRPRQRVAFGPVAIAAGVVPDARVLTAVTLLHVAAERGGPALFDNGHHSLLRQWHRRLEPIVIPVAAEDLRHLERGAHAVARRSNRIGAGGRTRRPAWP